LHTPKPGKDISVLPYIDNPVTTTIPLYDDDYTDTYKLHVYLRYPHHFTPHRSTSNHYAPYEYHYSGKESALDMCKHVSKYAHFYNI